MKKKKAYVVATAHLDTVWRWNLNKTINEYLPDTIKKNFELIEKYPNYVFNFEGAYRYELIEEFYPKAFEKITEYVKEGRWNPAGTAYETGDVNIPSPEAIFRNILLGDKYFSEKFNITSKELFLPDCFGFGRALPSIIKHAGLKGFTTQKLSWGSASGVPFDLGYLQGPDSRKIFASLDAKSYMYKFSGDIRADIGIISKIATNAAMGSLPITQNLYGTGDCGGAPDESSVMAVEESLQLNKIKPDFKIISAKTSAVFDALEQLPADEKQKLPIHDGELLMTSHGTGCYTSRTSAKRLNRKCETVADWAEKSCVFADSLGIYDYPRNVFEQAWKRVVRHQFHDDITGTSNMDVYRESFNDYALSISQFNNELSGSVEILANEINTAWIKRKNSALVVYNPTQFNRKGTVRARVTMNENCPFVRIFDGDGNEVESQVVTKKGKEFDVIFIAQTPSVGFSAYKVKASSKPCKLKSDLKIDKHSLENAKYKIVFNKNGDIAYLYDKELGKSLIDSPIKLALLKDTGSFSYPSWEIKKDDIDRKAYAYAMAPEFSIAADGPARISLKISRKAENSEFIQVVTLEPFSNYINVENFVNWNTRRTMLKAVFPLSAHNKVAAYDVGLGAVYRNTNSDELYEVPAQKWADITDNSGEYGVSVFSDSRYGWDKPNDNTLRLTCIHTPTGAFTKESRQDLQDLGRNYFSFAIFGHQGSSLSKTQKEAELFSNPMIAFQTSDRRKKGMLGKKPSFMSLNNDNVLVRAVKLCEYDRSVIIRVNEASGEYQGNVYLNLFKPLGSAKLVNACEKEIKNLKVTRGALQFDMKPFEIKTFKLTFEDDIKRCPRERFEALNLKFNAKGFTTNDNMRNTILQGSGFSLPYEQIKYAFYVGRIRFTMRQKPDDRYDVLVCRGQTIEIPEKTTRLYFVGASTLGDQDVVFKCDGKFERHLTVHSMKEPIFSWDMAGLSQTAKVKKNANLAFEFTHTHHPEGIKPDKARFYLYSVGVKNKKTLTLPENNKIVIIAMTAVKKFSDSRIATDLADSAENYEFAESSAIDKVIEQSEFVTIGAGKIENVINKAKRKGLIKDNPLSNIIRSYTKSE